MQTAIAAIFVFLLVILLHELGHFAVAKFVGIKVNEFAIGMGPKIFQTKKGETKYTLRALPIGGYVNMEGEDEASDDPRGFSQASPLARMAVIAAGALMNFVLAIIVLSIVSFNIGEPTTIIGEIQPGSPAEIAGIEPGDKIVNINKTKIKTWEDLSTTIAGTSPEEEMEIVLIREEGEKILHVRPIVEEGRSLIGIIPEYESSLTLAIKGGFEKTAAFIRLMFQFVGMIFRGQVSTQDLAGPVGVINEVGQAAKMGFTSLLLILGFISVNLGFFNLLPIPALDGSRLVFIFIELIRGKPIDPEKENFIHLVGFAFLIGLMLVVTYRDLIRINILK
ncbi:MAG TPA: RIP metalloprotease RseP [Tissierellaceae bacterium]|nr:RIP metalloprotease RseP [Tissierellaceae bacterium]